MIRKYRSPFLFSILLSLGGALWAGTEFWVSPTGLDLNPGTKERPFRSPERARDALRAARRSGLGDGALTVVLRGGTYPRSNTFLLGPEDGGSPSAPVTWTSAPGETARFFGGVELPPSAFQPVVDGKVLSSLPTPSARSNVRVARMKDFGVTEYGAPGRRGFGKANVGHLAPVWPWIGDRPLRLARWPNPEDWFPAMLNKYDTQRRGVVSRTSIVEPGPDSKDPDFGTRGGTFTVSFDRLARWTEAKDIWLDGCFSWSWEWSYNRVASLDPVRKQITLAMGEVSGLKEVYSGSWFFAENLLEELDEPGEFWMDRKEGLLYLIQGGAFAAAAPVMLSILTETMFEIRGASNLQVVGLHLDGGRAGAFSISGRSNRMGRCEISRFTGAGGTVGGQGNLLESNLLHDLGASGVWVQGGRPANLTPSGNRISNCEIRDWAWYHRVYTPAVGLGGCGQVVQNCRLHGAPHGAILVTGNDHRMVGNEIDDVCREFIDLGAIYINDKPLCRGWEIAGNWIHDIGAGPTAPINLAAIYIDHGTHGGLIEGNRFERIGSARLGPLTKAIIASGLYTVVRNNMFVDCPVAIHESAKPEPALYLEERNRDYQWPAHFASVNLAKTPHLSRYPELRRLIPGGDPLRAEDMWNRFDSNVIWNPAVPLSKSNGMSLEAKDLQKTPVIPTRAVGNRISDRDPGFGEKAGLTGPVGVRGRAER